MKTCPHCGSTNRVRRRRKGFVKHVHLIKFYNCLDCRENYYWIDLFKFSLKVKKATS